MSALRNGVEKKLIDEAVKCAVAIKEINGDI